MVRIGQYWKAGFSSPFYTSVWALSKLYNILRTTPIVKGFKLHLPGGQTGWQEQSPHKQYWMIKIKHITPCFPDSTQFVPSCIFSSTHQKKSKFNLSLGIKLLCIASVTFFFFFTPAFEYAWRKQITILLASAFFINFHIFSSFFSIGQHLYRNNEIPRDQGLCVLFLKYRYLLIPGICF